MKYIKYILAIAIVSLALQCMGLFLLDKVYYVPNNKYKTTKIDDTKIHVIDNVKINLPEDAQNIKASLDGKYISYLQNNVLYVVDLDNADKVEAIKFNSDEKLSYYTWTPNESTDVIVLAEKVVSSKGDYIKFLNYNAQNNVKNDINNLVDGYNDHINLHDKDSQVTDITISQGNLIYIKVSEPKRADSVYCIDVMSKMQKININFSTIGNIFVFSDEDKLAYENLSNNKVYISKVGYINTNKNTKPTLLGVDNNNNIYIGYMENNKINKISYGESNSDINSWQNIDLDTAKDKSDIFVNPNGDIFENDNSKKIIKNLKTNKEAVYKGSLCNLFNAGLLSVQDGILVKTDLK